MKHTKQVKNYQGSHLQLAEEIGDLYYDSLADLLRLLSEKIADDGDKDAARGRKRLATALHACAGHLTEAAAEIDAAWVICKPYVNNEHEQ